MLIVFGILYGMMVIGILALCAVASEADDLMEEEMQYIEAQKRLEAYQIKK